MTIQDVYDFMKKCNVYYLATVDGDQARVRPFGTVKLYEGRLYFQTGKVKPCSKQIHAAPKVELCCFDGEKWLRVAGTAVEDPRTEAAAAMLEDYPNLQAMYKPGDGNCEVFWLKDATATFSSFTAAPEIVTF